MIGDSAGIAKPIGPLSLSFPEVEGFSLNGSDSAENYEWLAARVNFLLELSKFFSLDELADQITNGPDPDVVFSYDNINFDPSTSEFLHLDELSLEGISSDAVESLWEGISSDLPGDFLSVLESIPGVDEKNYFEIIDEGAGSYSDKDAFYLMLAMLRSMRGLSQAFSQVYGDGTLAGFQASLESGNLSGISDYSLGVLSFFPYMQGAVIEKISAFSSTWVADKAENYVDSHPEYKGLFDEWKAGISALDISDDIVEAVLSLKRKAASRIMAVGLFNQYMRQQYKSQMEKYKEKVDDVRKDKLRTEKRGKKSRARMKKLLQNMRKNKSQFKNLLQKLALRAQAQKKAGEAAMQKAAQKRAAVAASAKKASQRRKEG